MRYWIARLLTGLMLAMAPAVTTADMIIGSWNVRQLGWENGKDIKKLAHIIQSMDLMAIQELMSDDALGELVNQLETLTGEPWESMASHSLGKGERYREHYGFVWRESEVDICKRLTFHRSPIATKISIAADDQYLIMVFHSSLLIPGMTGLKER